MSVNSFSTGLGQPDRLEKIQGQTQRQTRKDGRRKRQTRKTDRQPHRKRYRSIDPREDRNKVSDREKDRLAEKQTGGKINRETNGHSYESQRGAETFR